MPVIQISLKPYALKSRTASLSMSSNYRSESNLPFWALDRQLMSATRLTTAVTVILRGTAPRFATTNSQGTERTGGPGAGARPATASRWLPAGAPGLQLLRMRHLRRRRARPVCGPAAGGPWGRIPGGAPSGLTPIRVPFWDESRIRDESAHSGCLRVTSCAQRKAGSGVPRPAQVPAPPRLPPPHPPRVPERGVPGPGASLA